MYRITIELDTDSMVEATEIAERIYSDIGHFVETDYMVDQPMKLEPGQEHSDWHAAEEATKIAEIINLDAIIFTVAKIQDFSEVLEVMFLESARIYTLPHTHPKYQELFEVLRDALNSKQQVKVDVEATEIKDVEATESVPEGITR